VRFANTPISTGTVPQGRIAAAQAFVQQP
jgi:hypothetical protein